MYKYFAWKEHGAWRGQKLLSYAQINSLKETLGYDVEMFSTMQNYNKDGQVIDCPIFMDFDGKKAFEDVSYANYILQSNFNLSPWAFFSGKKGYHLVLPYKVVSPFCHYIVRHFVLGISDSLKSLDTKVYRFRSMFRLNNTRHSSGLFKIPISADELFHMKHEDIKDLAQSPRLDYKLHEIDLIKLEESSVFEEAMTRAHNEGVPEFNGVDASKYDSKIEEEITPCVRKLLASSPLPGDRNMTAFILARFLKRYGLDLNSALSIMYQNPNFREHSKEVERVFISTFNSKRTAYVGCKAGLGHELMRQNCNWMCHFNREERGNGMPTTSEEEARERDSLVLQGKPFAKTSTSKENRTCLHSAQ